MAQCWFNIFDRELCITQEVVVFLNFVTHHIHSQVWKKMMTRCDNNPTLPSYKSLCFSRKIHECLVLCSKSLEWRIFTAHLQGSLWHFWELAQTVQYGCFWKIVGFPPKSSTLIGFSMIFTIHFGVPLFLETPISSESIMEWNGRNVLTWCPSARFLDLQFRHKSSKANRQTLPVDSARPCQSSQCLPCTFPPNKTFNFLKCSHHLQLP